MVDLMGFECVSELTRSKHTTSNMLTCVHALVKHEFIAIPT